MSEACRPGKGLGHFDFGNKSVNANALLRGDTQVIAEHAKSGVKVVVKFKALTFLPLIADMGSPTATSTPPQPRLP